MHDKLPRLSRNFLHAFMLQPIILGFCQVLIPFACKAHTHAHKHTMHLFIQHQTSAPGARVVCPALTVRHGQPRSIHVRHHGHSEQGGRSMLGLFSCIYMYRYTAFHSQFLIPCPRRLLQLGLQLGDLSGDDPTVLEFRRLPDTGSKAAR